MVTFKRFVVLSLVCLFISACSGNYKSSDDNYRPIGQPPITIDNKTK